MVGQQHLLLHIFLGGPVPPPPSPLHVSSPHSAVTTRMLSAPGECHPGGARARGPNTGSAERSPLLTSPSQLRAASCPWVRLGEAGSIQQAQSGRQVRGHRPLGRCSPARHRTFCDDDEGKPTLISPCPFSVTRCHGGPPCPQRGGWRSTGRAGRCSRPSAAPGPWQPARPVPNGPERGRGLPGVGGHSPREGGRDCGGTPPTPAPPPHPQAGGGRLRSCWEERNHVDTSGSPKASARPVLPGECCVKATPAQRATLSGFFLIKCSFLHLCHPGVLYHDVTSLVQDGDTWRTCERHGRGPASRAEPGSHLGLSVGSAPLGASENDGGVPAAPAAGPSDRGSPPLRLRPRLTEGSPLLQLRPPSDRGVPATPAADPCLRLNSLHGGRALSHM